MEFWAKTGLSKTFRTLFKKGAFLWVIVLLLVGSNIFLIFQSEHRIQKVGYVKLAEVYTKFKMKEDMEGQIIQIQKQREQVLYNMKAEILAQEKEKDKGKKPTLTEADFQQKIADFQADDKKIVSDFDQRLWKQLNQYIQDYSAENHYDLLLGADGSGTMMAANESLDKTNDIIAYVNQRYEGSK